MERRVLIFGYYGRGNAGDDAMLYCLLDELAGQPELQFSVVAFGSVPIPQSCHERVRLCAPSFLRVVREVLRSSIVVLGGGTHIHDFNASKRYLRVLAQFLIFISTNKALGRRVYLVGVGIGPLETWWGRLLGGAILRLADGISTRDSASLSLLEQRGISGSGGFDIGALLELRSEQRDPASGKVLGISLLPYYAIYHNRPEDDRRFEDAVVGGLRAWMDGDAFREVAVFSAKEGREEDDRALSLRITERLGGGDRVRRVPYEGDPWTFWGHVADCDLFVAMRLHAAVFAYAQDLPLAIVAYHPKCASLARDIGLPDHAVVTPPQILAGQLPDLLEKMTVHGGDFRGSLPVAVARQRARMAIESLGIGAD